MFSTANDSRCTSASSPRSCCRHRCFESAAKIVSDVTPACLYIVVLQCVAVYCKLSATCLVPAYVVVLQGVAVCCRVLQGVAVCCRVLQCVAVCCSVLQCVAVRGRVLQCVLHRVAVYCSVLQQRHMVCCCMYESYHIYLDVI